MVIASASRRRVVLSVTLVAALSWLAAGCSDGSSGSTESPTGPSASAAESLPPVEGDAITATDYSDPASWAAVPQDPDQPVDVFLLYPTAYEGQAPLADISDPGMRAGADRWLADSGSAFETAGNVYMPYYRQLNAGWALTQPLDQQQAYQRGVPKADVLAAFDYYLNSYNDGRPFVLGSHSQGATMLKEIVFDYLVEHPDVMPRLVAAYAIGYSVTDADLARNPQTRFAEGADDTGVVISWNTVAPDAAPVAGSVIQTGSLAINPISWTRSGQTAPASDNLGSYVEVDGTYQQVMDLADATVATIGDDYGVVVCSTADEATYAMGPDTVAVFGPGSFHGNDIQLYYYNLRQNVENRVAKYLENH